MIKDNLIIRKIKVSEIPQFLSVMQQSIFEEFPEFSDHVKEFFFRKFLYKERVGQRLKEKLVTCWAAFEKDRTVAYLDAQVPEGGIVFIHWLGVLKPYQNRNIGKRLLSKFERWAKKQGAHAIHLVAIKKNTGFYKKLGFKEVGLIEKNYYGVDQYYLYKVLQEPKEENFLK